MALSLAIIWLTISANRSLNQASSKQFVMSTQAYAIFFGYLLLAAPKGDARHAQPVAKSAMWGIGHRHPPHPLVSVASQRGICSAGPSFTRSREAHGALDMRGLVSKIGN